MRILRWLYRLWCSFVGIDVPIWALPMVGRMKNFDSYGRDY